MPTDSGLRIRKLQLIIDQIDKLPTLPAVASRVLSMACSDDASARDLTQIIEGDQSLTSRIIALASSAGVGGGKNVSSVDRAVALLGFEAIRNSVLSLKVFDLFNGQGHRANRTAFDRTAFWKHCMAVAVAAQMIARRTRGVDGGEAFVAGLLHDVGKVALDFALPKTFDQVVRRVSGQRLSFAQAETRILGLDHAAIGRRLATNWGFPEPLVNAIWLHHQTGTQLPEDVAGRRLIEVVHLANIIARQERIGVSSPPADATLARQAAAALKLPEDFLDRLTKDLRAAVAEQVQIMGLDKTDEKGLFLESIQSANSELGVINEQLIFARSQLQRHHRINDAITDLCRAAGQWKTAQTLRSAAGLLVREGLGCTTCALFWFGDDGTYVEGTVSQADRKTDNHFLFEVSPEQGGAALPQGFVRAEQPMGWLFERLGEQLGNGAFYCHALGEGEQAFGAVVLGFDEPNESSMAYLAPDVASLAAILASVVASWRDRERLSIMAEQLVAASQATADAQDELIRQRNLASIGSMAAGAAHEINNPLAVVSGRAQILAETETDEKKRGSLEIICQQAERASDIIKELMTFARAPALDCRPTDLGALLTGGVEAMQEELGERDVALALKTPMPEAPDPSIDAEQIGWVVQELVRNAGTACQSGENVTVSVEHDEVAGLLTVVVHDDGCGMDRETVEQACEPFFSGRHAAKRRGLGLAKVQRIAEAHGASLQIDSAEGEGTTVRLTFDLDHEPAAAGAAAAEASA